MLSKLEDLNFWCCLLFILITIPMLSKVAIFAAGAVSCICFQVAGKLAWFRLFKDKGGDE